MANANHSAPTFFQDCFVHSHESFQTRRIFPRLRFAETAPPVFHLWMKLSGRWIEEAGFEPEQRLQIEVTHQRLAITPIAEEGRDCFGKDERPDVDPATGQALRQLAAMTGNAQ
ncbi:hypothetical protein A8F23_02865 [Burkholderia cenocepacia]|uniref:SymE family type I addiction module toxin n=1 Tax=Burkholderia cenocepacia TaxID=95486 RepID=UPI000980E15C|nr:SymE family type I addiction module toxin [Burkholderia cenocepacia]ONY37855.1 hypothetical protein A8F23_02865 [Burkholderia cenocepacia]